MRLSPGDQLGPYSVVETLGSGGMGEVYRARDEKLGRDVALKILPDALVSEAGRLARFEREARTLAALNHPNIAHVYDAGTSEGTAFLVMELVEGEELSAHIARGPMTLADALPIAGQIIDGLEAAHEAGIVHRDLKPANVKVRPDGTVKLLDFGLAKAFASEPATTSDSSMSPTLTARATQMGTIIGTAAYMSPEQARGKPVDRRADIWAFGVVLYEMLTGRRAFHGEDVSVTLASVIKEDVRWDALHRDLPLSVRRLLRRCLEKDPRRRLSAIGDARLELNEEELGRRPEGREEGRRTAWSRLWPALAGVAMTAIIAYALWPSRESGMRPPPVRFSVSAESADGVWRMAPRLSPDGHWLAWVAPASGSPDGPVIWIRPMDGLEPHALPGTERARLLFWSPRSDAIGYAVNDEIYRVSVDGAVPQKVCTVADFQGAAWLRSGDILLSAGAGTPAARRLLRVSSQGGIPAEVPLPKAEGPAARYTHPEMLPDGRHFIYLGWNPVPGAGALFLGSLDGAEPVRLVQADVAGAVAAGYLLFQRSGALFAQPFDTGSLRLSGDPVRIADGILNPQLGGTAAFSVSSTGVLAYRKESGSGPPPTELVWLDRSGKPTGTVGNAGSYVQIRLSPDGKRVALATIDFRVSVLDLGNGVTTPLTDPALLAGDPVWSKDSQIIAFVAAGKGNELLTQQIGSDTTQSAVAPKDRPQWLSDWSPDGRFLIHHSRGSLYLAEPGKPESLKLLLKIEGDVDGAHVSPDGNWIAYQVLEGGTTQVWVATFPALQQRRQVSSQGGGQAMWRGDGRELFYLTPDGKLMSVRIDLTDPSGPLSLATPVELFKSSIPNPWLPVDQYAVTRDGQHFLFIRPHGTEGVTDLPITVVVNWTSALKER